MRRAFAPALVRPLRAVDDFLFRPVDARAAGALRVLLALAVPWFFRPWTFAPSPRWLDGGAGLGLDAAPWLYAHVFGTPGHAAVGLALCALLALGWRPRVVAALLVAVLLPMLFPSGGQRSRQVVLFVLTAFAFVRSDAAWTPFRARPADAGPLWPVRLIQLQLTVLYGVNAWAKAKPAYLGGDVLVAMSVALPNFRVDLASGALELGPLAVPVAALAVASVATEAFLALAFWVRPLRWPAALVGVAFHGALRFVVQIHMLGWASQLLYASFLLPLDRRRD